MRPALAKKIVTRMLTRDFQDGFRLSVDTEAIKNLEIMSRDYGQALLILKR